MMQNTHDSLDMPMPCAGCGDWPPLLMTSETWDSVSPKSGSHSNQDRPARELRSLRLQGSLLVRAARWIHASSSSYSS